MKMFYSPETKGFYREDFHHTIPESVIEISQEQHRSLIEGQSTGKSIVYKDGELILVEPTANTDALINRCKQTAQSLLSATDWTQLADVRAGLVNSKAFDSYREKVRALRSNPVADPTWPVAPEPEWK